MYMGVRSYHELPSVSSYTDAKRALDVWNSKPRKGKRRDQVNFDESTGAIGFQLYDTEVVAWYPDDSIDIDNYGTATTSGYARHFLPAGIYLSYPTSRNGQCGGSNIINFVGRDEDGKRTHAVCQGSVVRFNPTPDGRWAPDEDTCDSIKLPTGVDRKKASQVMKQYHLGDFTAWLSMAPMHLDGAGATIEHDQWDVQDCMDALRERDFRKATTCMPLMDDTGAYGHKPRPLPIGTPYRKYISLGCVDKLKLAIWDVEGLLRTEERKVWAREEFEQHMRRVRGMDKLGMYVGDMGPRT